jgi:protein TonB
MRLARVAGAVITESTITATGCVTDARVVRSVQTPLDVAALRAVLGWRFEPTLLDGKPVPVIMTVTTTFTLK